MLLPVFPPCTLELPEIPESMFLVSYDGSTDLGLSEQILSDPKDACSQASFGFELSAPIYFILSNVEFFLAREAPRQKEFDTSQDKVKTSCSLLGTVTLFLNFRAMATLTRVFVVMVRGIDDVFTPFCLLSNQLSG